MTPDETADPDESRPDRGTAPVLAALAALGPVRMPDDVAARIRSRLDDEVGAGVPAEPAPARPAASRTAPPTSPEPDPPSARRASSAPPSPAARSGSLHAVPPAETDRTRSAGLPAGAPRRAPHRPGRPARAGLALLAAAAATVLVVLPLTWAGQASDPVPAGTTGPLADELRTAAGGAGEPAGPLADPARRHACLVVAGVPDPDAPLVAARPYPVAGRPGVLLVLGTPDRGRFRLVVVDPGCGPGRGVLLAALPAGP